MPEHTPAPTPSRGVYGFAMYLTFRISFILYLTWAIIPEKYFRMMGITCLPQRYWAIAVPIFFLTVLTVFAFVIYPSLGLMMTPGIDDMRTIRDSASKSRKDHPQPKLVKSNTNKCVCKDKEHCYQEYYDNECVVNPQKPLPVLSDLDIWDVSERLYLK